MKTIKEASAKAESKKVETKKSTTPITKLKGTKDIRGQDYYQLQGMFEKAQEISEYYGFKPMDTPILERSSIYEKALGEVTDVVEKEMYSFSIKGSERVALRPEFTAGILRSYIENGMVAEPQPILLYSYGPVFRHENPQLGRLREFRQFNLEILGTEKSIADALIIKTTYDILTDFGFKDLIIDINSMGDSDTRNSYLRELTSYYKKHISNMCSNCDTRLKTNPLRLLDCKDELCQTFKEKAPQSINSISPDARKHFKEVLQYLEEMEIPFRINHSLVRGLDYYKRTVFEIIKEYTTDAGDTKEITICGGGRYDMSKMYGSKKDIPSVGTALGFDRLTMMPECEKLMPKILKTPKVYFIQLGFEAKLKSLHVIDVLRHAKIPVHQNLSKDSLGAQLSAAEEMGIPYAIIFGQKEAIDGNVIIRDMKKHTQEVVKIDKLCDYIKHLK